MLIGSTSTRNSLSDRRNGRSTASDRMSGDVLRVARNPTAPVTRRAADAMIRALGGSSH